jgi:hypothetical protein
MNEHDELCYMCNEHAISKEHIPPKCLFPELKDIPDKNFRTNLITVPSCVNHNSKKSNDDEFLMVGLAGVIGNNSIGYRHHMGKVNRAIKRSSYKLLEEVFLKKKTYPVKLEENKFIDFIWGTPDIDRLNRCFRHIAYGLYLHHFKKRFKGNIKVIMGHVISKEPNPETFKQFIKHRFDVDLREKEKLGENKDIFYYQFIEPDNFGLIALKMCFYDGVDVYISFIPEGTQLPANLTMELIERGIKTYISIEDKTYEFN